ncbi:NADH:ubiquinone reductase (Na(+)-transporting) subunit D [Pseudomarimonas arenosa]|uniref:NADH:ubiquinone reductase (Na(+)-transporting) subunit D n=1 Tax=Pseudomarimonas arenosa TaxID=2774145 RepID=A0AAW3ZK35_9GAMM|nr:NADH:ubiquinone reductase (Na(+)-transporting) subunit D [Pseudomarimonas arenosa]MBD8526118.1 NADH:ubiquinone reductase (Na(+)-transporting) subunit D [Pseudomarimonas arenosa]
MSWRRWRARFAPVIQDNPITVQMLGLCSALAVTTSLSTAITMSIALSAVLLASSAAISLIRHFLPNHVRLIIQITVIASLVIVVDQILQAYWYSMSQRLSIFVSLIVTNCLVMGRAEGFASQHGLLASLWDALLNGLGYSLMLILIGALRELLGAGQLLGVQLLPLVEQGGWFEPLKMMLLAPSAFFLLGLLVWALRSRWPQQVEGEEFRPRLAELGVEDDDA